MISFVSVYILTVCLLFAGCSYVSPSAITEVSIISAGMGYRGLGFNNSIVLRSDGTAEKTETEINEEKGKAEFISYRGKVSKEQFERIAALVIKNKFFSMQDTNEQISEGYSSRMKVVHSKGMKETKIPFGKGDEKIEEIKTTMREIEKQISWERMK